MVNPASAFARKRLPLTASFIFPIMYLMSHNLTEDKKEVIL